MASSGSRLPQCADAPSLAEAIAQRCNDAHPYQDGWRAQCPHHQGSSTTSLAITPHGDCVLLKCFAECSQTDIVHAMGLTLADLYVQERAGSGPAKRIVEVYDYVDAQGQLVFQTVRMDPKDFRQRRPDPVNPGQYVWNLDGVTLVLYHLPEVLAAVAKGEPIYLVEGEKDVETLRQLGITATCNPMGAGKWRQGYTDTLYGAHMVLLADNDAPGRKHMLRVAELLTGSQAVADLKLVETCVLETPGSDITDWLQSGRTLGDLHSVVAETPFYRPDARSPLAKARPPKAATPSSASPPVTPPPAPPRNIPPGPTTDDTDPWLPWSDYTNARAFVEDHGSVVHYVYAWKVWLVWNGHCWERDTTGAVMRMAKATVKKLARQLPDVNDDHTKVFITHLKNSLKTSALEALVRSAQSEPGVPILPTVLDTDPWLLNCVNGTLDLRTGLLRPHRQSDFLTKCLPLLYIPQARCPTWDQFLWRIMGGSVGADTPDMTEGELQARQRANDRAQSLILFLQQAIGYTLTGSTREQCMFILHGPTKTGKSTFLATIRALLGVYAQQADMTSFMHKDRDEVRNDLADLAGSRFVAALESQEGRRLAESLVKQLTGGTDLIKARFLFEEYFSYKPQFKIFLGTNHKPLIKDTDSAIWERIRLVPFTEQIPVEERDKSLEERLLQELTGILTWAVEGCLAWQQGTSLREPPAVVEATAQYRSEMDTMSRFIDECCQVGAPTLVKCRATALTAAYQQWCRKTGEWQLSNSAFIADMERRQYTRERGAGNQFFWYGIGLLDTSDARLPDS